VTEKATEWDEGLKAWVSTVERKFLQEPTGYAPVQARDPDMRILLGIPMERTISQHAFFAFYEIAMHGWALARLEYTRNDIARQMLAQFCIESNCTHVVMLDSDHTHPPDVVERLARWFRAYPDIVEVVGGLNFRRGAPYDPCAFVDPGDDTFRRIATWYPGAMNVEALGTGSIMIARTVFDRLPQPWFGYDYTAWQGWPGTDMWFSALCRKAGITLWCDTTTTSPHITDRFVAEADYRQWITEHGVPPEQIVTSSHGTPTEASREALSEVVLA
jgi:hypothetical protein